METKFEFNILVSSGFRFKSLMPTFRFGVKDLRPTFDQTLL